MTNDLVSTCTACHGENGNSINSNWPNLAGQKKTYLEIQLKEFRDGTRKDPLMSEFAKKLSDEKISDIAIYYSKQKALIRNISEVNQQGKNVRAHCISCHGVRGFTVNQQWPNLAGQQKDYLKKQLMDFKSDKRTSPQMQVIAKELSDQQIEAVAEYYSQL